MTRPRLAAALGIPAVLAGGALGVTFAPSAQADMPNISAASAEQTRSAKLAAQLAAERVAHRRLVTKLRAALRGARSRPAYVWWSTGDTRKVAEAVFDEKGIPEYQRARWRCIFTRESGWRHDVWYGGARGWRPEYAGTDRVNGLAQLRPFWAWWWLNGAKGPAPRHDASLTTYRVTSDPVTSVRIALRIGFRPFYAQRGAC